MTDAATHSKFGASVDFAAVVLEEEGFYKLLPANKANYGNHVQYVDECVYICVRLKVRGAAIPLTKIGPERHTVSQIAASQPLRCA